MNRRGFLRMLGLAPLAVVATPVVAASRSLNGLLDGSCGTGGAIDVGRASSVHWPIFHVDGGTPGGLDRFFSIPEEKVQEFATIAYDEGPDAADVALARYYGLG